MTSAKLNDFIIVKSADPDEYSNYDLNEESDLDDDNDGLVGMNVIEIQTRK